jgi:pyruvate/2-oxoglutarate/acetoin dehydrogenase E1 component
MSAGQINVPIVFRGPNGAAAGVGAQHSQVCDWNISLSICVLINILYPVSSVESKLKDSFSKKSDSFILFCIKM